MWQSQYRSKGNEVDMDHRCPLNNYRARTAAAAAGLRGYEKITKEITNRRTVLSEST